jgi:hypothetical protein
MSHFRVSYRQTIQRGLLFILLQLAVFWFPCSLDDTAWLVAVCFVTVGCVLVSLQPVRYSVARCGLFCYSWLCFGFPAAWTIQRGSLLSVLLQLAVFWFPCSLNDTAWLVAVCIVTVSVVW